MKTVPTPTFSWVLLSPKYWLVWLSFSFLALLVNVLPFSILKALGFGIGRLSQHFLKKRADIARTNLKLCFPDHSSEEIDNLVIKNFQNTGLAIIETGMAWFWPDWRVKRHISILGKDKILQQEKEGRGVLVICCHFLNLEMTARIFSLFAPGYGVYRANSNPVYEFIQHRGRTRKGHQMIDRRDVKSMIKVLKSGNRLWYLPDHDYGRKNSVFVPFFAVNEAATTTGSSFLIDMTKCAVMSGTSIRQGGHYTLEVGDDLSGDIPRRDAVTAATVLNQEIERLIEKEPSQWMWLHKRFKTLPEDSTQQDRYKTKLLTN
ncbi:MULTISPECIES: Kdo(2)-lipid IV(A) acyltransferase [unclassified Aliivibrio]|uniref:Kdo(2)-lipid IV(A) acyltransferase n=1 Tax=unclassified Aliivibrio TaxID=2645654 RepID=UPI00080D9C67|nr:MULTISPECIES: Kdo(2)-lipid IV(A) acyltransferase [unclassified Aliivibrio]OCH13831.1 lipid A biosynthesis acyltransferase [Aliivibrio sp. 1S165]OCH25969.1 lipid A biosynthesis acyltransferase [Aliivibrio sp. 1S128]OCH31528.1 lipid A biosynthesis acyltransferase [Aliivibrio sp. 1S175]